MKAGGASRGASFDGIAGTLDPDVVLHQSSDLPWGGEYRGRAGYAEWARKMSDAFDQLEVRDEQLFEQRDTVVSVCRLVTRSRANGSIIDAPMTQLIKVKRALIVEFRPVLLVCAGLQRSSSADRCRDWMKEMIDVDLNVCPACCSSLLRCRGVVHGVQ